MRDSPFEDLTHRERLKVSRYRDLFPDRCQQDRQTQLFVSLGRLYYLSSEKLKFTYLPKPTLKYPIPIEQAKKMFDDLLSSLREQLGLNEKYTKLFTREGQKVSSIFNIVEGGQTFFISCLDRFEGIEKAAVTYRGRIDRFISQVTFYLTSLLSSSTHLLVTSQMLQYQNITPSKRRLRRNMEQLRRT